MNDPLRVRRLQRGRNLDGEPEDLANRKLATLQTSRQTFPFDQLQHEKLSLVLMTDVEEAADVGVVEQ